ncbi:MAG TPA: endolytic transglycosylase MltG [Xanthobacteraceae bacterium]|nr:endolytic transglycosylase MltG [Xanthobacteraceae bacterium]
MRPGADVAGAERRRVIPRSPRAALEPERLPEPPKRSAGARHPMVVAGNAVFTILVLLALVGGGAVFYGRQQLDAKGPLAADKIVNIPRAGVRDVADTLEREGVIDKPYLFIAMALLQKAKGELRAGEYQFSREASLQEVLGTMIEGKVVQHNITIPEGLTSEQIVQRLLEMNVLAGNIREIPREGSLMPETYRVTRGTTREQVIQRMQQAQRRVLQESWERRASDLPLRSPEELLVLASIVEKETGKPEERARVAAVFVNRLKQRMKLQSDPTIIYGLVGGRATLGRPITRSEITQPTPYNTYTIEGLPPGPIANPGRASIEATASPARTREIFFVADGTGGHAFSESLEQHNRNVAKLRALEQNANDTSTAASADPAPEAAPAQQPAARPRPQQSRPQQAAPRPLAPPAQATQNPPRARVQ